MAAGPMFPQRTGAGPLGMAGSSGSQLDAPPPSPVQPSAVSLGEPAALPNFSEMAQPFTAGSPSRATSPEILMGVMSGAETIYGMLDNMASIIPDCANDFALQKDLLQRTLAKLLVKGGSPASPTSSGLNYPGGGFSSGAQ